MREDSQVIDAEPLSSTVPSPGYVRLGEELPVFCERCGYSLHGLAQLRCEACAVLHFACPECGHHQPINTLRPAFQRTLGRLRAMGLALIAFLKINFFFWSLFIWGAAGTGISYEYHYSGPNVSDRWVPVHFEVTGAVIFFMFALAHGMVARMLLLRWRRGWKIGLALGGLIVLALFIGAHLRQYEMREPLPSPIQSGFIGYIFWAFIGACVGSACAWTIWLALVHLFLPKRAAIALIAWQRRMSEPDTEPDRTDMTTSVIA